MEGKTIGLAIGGSNVADVQAATRNAERAGIDAVWMTTGGARAVSYTHLTLPTKA